MNFYLHIRHGRFGNPIFEMYFSKYTAQARYYIIKSCKPVLLPILYCVLSAKIIRIFYLEFPLIYQNICY